MAYFLLPTVYMGEVSQLLTWTVMNFNSDTGGHPGISNTLDLVKQKYHGPKLREYVSKDVLNVKKAKLSDYLMPPYTTLTPQQKKGPSNMSPWISSLIHLNPKDMTLSQPLWIKDVLRQLNSYHATRKSLEKE